jgi:protein-histidine N-methyltransferase
MAEEDIEKPEDQGVAGISSDDIVSRVYEGGFKTWECSVDLAVYIKSLLNKGTLNLGDKVHVIEVCGSRLALM